jgi:hypothetical protein
MCGIVQTKNHSEFQTLQNDRDNRRSTYSIILAYRYRYSNIAIIIIIKVSS